MRIDFCNFLYMEPHLLCHHLHASESSRACVCLCASPFTHGDHIVFGCMQIGIGLVKRGHFPGGEGGVNETIDAGSADRERALLLQKAARHKIYLHYQV